VFDTGHRQVSRVTVPPGRATNSEQRTEKELRAWVSGKEKEREREREKKRRKKERKKENKK
jgi:hypothetical protein